MFYRKICRLSSDNVPHYIYFLNFICRSFCFVLIDILEYSSVSDRIALIIRYFEKLRSWIVSDLLCGKCQNIKSLSHFKPSTYRV